MRIEVVNCRPEFALELFRFLRKDLSKSLRIAKVRVRHRAAWVQTDLLTGFRMRRIDGGSDPVECQELRMQPIISFDLKPFPDDYAMQVLTTAFEGSGLAFNASNGMRWLVG